MPKKITKTIQEDKPQDTRLSKYQRIMLELDEFRKNKNPNKKETKGGRKPDLDYETYSQIIISLEYGLTEAQMMTTGIINSRKLFLYKSHSETFRNEIERAKQATSVSAIMHIATKIHGKPERISKVYDRDGKEILKTQPAEEPDTELAKWWLQRKNKDEFSLPNANDRGAGVSPSLGAPQTEREKELQLELLKMYHDYTKSEGNQETEDNE